MQSPNLLQFIISPGKAQASQLLIDPIDDPPPQATLPCTSHAGKTGKSTHLESALRAYGLMGKAPQMSTDKLKAGLRSMKKRDLGG